MPLQNRVDPFGELFADPALGLFMGNRGGRIHTGDAHAGAPALGRRGSGSAACSTSRGGIARSGATVYTELFFLDEVTALAAGHRPCFECRRARCAAPSRKCWRRGQRSNTRPSAADMDAMLHERAARRPRQAAARPARLAELPDGAVVVIDGRAFAVRGDALLYWTPDGYATRQPRPRSGTVEVLTPPSMLAVLAAGYPAALASERASER